MQINQAVTPTRNPVMRKFESSEEHPKPQRQIRKHGLLGKLKTSLKRRIDDSYSQVPPQV